MKRKKKRGRGEFRIRGIKDGKMMGRKASW